VFRGRLIAGSFPRERVLDDVLAAGVSVFVCLVTHKELDRAGGPYLDKARRVLLRVAAPGPDAARRAAELEVMHVPIFDMQTADDKVADELSSRVVAMLAAGKVVYMHCMGGHGRTGTIASLVIAKACGVRALTALEINRRCHDQRGQCAENPGVFQSPETHEQRDQVFRLIDRKKKPT
jgi:hypothetical protein